MSKRDLQVRDHRDRRQRLGGGRQGSARRCRAACKVWTSQLSALALATRRRRLGLFAWWFGYPSLGKDGGEGFLVLAGFELKREGSQSFHHFVVVVVVVAVKIRDILGTSMYIIVV